MFARRSTPILAFIFMVVCWMSLSGSLLAQRLGDRWSQAQDRWHTQGERIPEDAVLLTKLIYTDVDVAFHDMPVKEALDWLSEQVGTRFQISMLNGKSMDGIDPEIKITLNFLDMPALNVLEHILDQCASQQQVACTWQLRWGMVYIGPTSVMDEARFRTIRIYDVGDLVMTIPDYDEPPELQLGGTSGGGGFGGGGGSGGAGGFGGGGGGGGGGDHPRNWDWEQLEEENIQQLILILQTNIEPTAWQRNGGDAASINVKDSSLIIRAPGYIQRQIDGFPFEIPGVHEMKPRTISIVGRTVMVQKPLSEQVKQNVIGGTSQQP
ncbi:MAG: hypothetical protein VX527_10925 [Planctomycetota bacterium]|nr:hypothetical protein [Planctomycetota bacterium]